ncbi:MAG: agmatinase [Candidatus Micrarchaeota archaeon]
MKHLYALEPHNFCGVEDMTFEKSKVVVLPVPYDSTTYYRAGTRDGPDAIIDASRHMELYDMEFECEPVYEVGIFTLEGLAPSKKSPEDTIKRVQEVLGEVVEAGKFPLMLGGEHSITLGAAKALKQKYKEISVLQIDAHADLRDELDGTRFGHACVMRRTREICKNVVQVGIRSICIEEAEFIKKNKLSNCVFTPEKFDVDAIMEKLGNDVYLTIDLDGFDPSEMPAVGTPVSNGLRLKEVFPLLKRVAREKNLVGFDVVELAPIPGFVSADCFAAELAYKVIGYKFTKK